jgi:hypothetical protein
LNSLPRDYDDRLKINHFFFPAKLLEDRNAGLFGLSWFALLSCVCLNAGLFGFKVLER